MAELSLQGCADHTLLGALYMLERRDAALQRAAPYGDIGPVFSVQGQYAYACHDSSYHLNLV